MKTPKLTIDGPHQHYVYVPAYAHATQPTTIAISVAAAFGRPERIADSIPIAYEKTHLPWASRQKRRGLRHEVAMLKAKAAKVAK